MEKFTIADKHEAQEVLENDTSLSPEDKEILNTKPVFRVLKSLFEKYYNVELLSVNESTTSLLLFTTKPIDKYWLNKKESYVSMVPSNDYLVFGKPLVETNVESSNEFLSEEEVQKIDKDIHSKIKAYINEHLANWTEMCEGEDEAESLESFLDYHTTSWRVRGDGTVDVIIEGESRESFDFSWKMGRKKMTSNALDLLRGNVSHEFDDDGEECNNNFTWDKKLEEKVISLFK
jgi:hypothetical protein